MKRLLLLVFSVLCAMTPRVWAQSVTGYWSGDLDVSGRPLQVCFNITGEGDSLSATMDVPAQGARGIAVSAISFDGVNLSLEIEAIKASFKGVAFLGVVSGTFSQSGLTLPLKMVKSEPKALERPQNPSGPFPYSEEEVAFVNEREGVTLAGTFTFPDGVEHAPAVILVTGSGAQNRDEELFGHRPFAVIADYLARHGIASLRYDDRGVGGSQPGPEGATTDDLSYDAQAAVASLHGDGRIKSVGVLGHSEGGAIAFQLGSRMQLDFVISLAGPSVRGDAVLAAQQEAIYRAGGVSEEAIAANAALFSRLYGAVLSSSTPAEAEPGVRELLAGAPAADQDKIVSQLLNPWMFNFIKYDPLPSIEGTSCPSLVLDGTLDMQVLSSQNLPVFREVAARHPERRIDIHEMPGLNHLFQHAVTGLPAEYGAIDETISEEVLSIIVEFINSL